MKLEKTKTEMRKALQEALKRVDAKEAQFVANTSQAVNHRKSVNPHTSSAEKKR